MRKDFAIAVSGSCSSEWVDQLYPFYHSTRNSSPSQKEQLSSLQHTLQKRTFLITAFGFSRIVDDLVSENFMTFYAFMSILCLFYDISTFHSFFMIFYDFMPSGSPVNGYPAIE